MGGKFLLCSHYKNHRCRPRKWAESVIRTLDKRANQAEMTTDLHLESCDASGEQGKWPLSLLIDMNADTRLLLHPSAL
jgi:hypothetical protein